MAHKPLPELEIEDPDFEKRHFPGLSPEVHLFLQLHRAETIAFLASDLGRMRPRQKAKGRKDEGKENPDR